MSAQWGICAVALALAVVLGVVAVVAQRRTARALAAARSESAALAERLEELERRAREPRPAPRETPEHVITLLGDEVEEQPAAAPAVPGPLFADLVLREGVVQAASLAAGVRRALAPEQRHRIRLEMRREVKRARKQRRSEVRDARRHLAAQERGDVARGESAA